MNSIIHSIEELKWVSTSVWLPSEINTNILFKTYGGGVCFGRYGNKEFYDFGCEEPYSFDEVMFWAYAPRGPNDRS